MLRMITIIKKQNKNRGLPSGSEVGRGESSVFRQNSIAGFSLVEMLVVLAILTILISMVVSSFDKMGGSEALDTTTVSIISVLNEAKSLAVSSKSASNYGVRILSDKIISFKNNYGTSNKEVGISHLVAISTSTGIGTDIIFNNVTGQTNASGTITITILNDISKSNIIRIYSTGVIEKN